MCRDSSREAESSPPGNDAFSVAAGVSDFVEGFLRYEPRIVNVLRAADAHPEDVLANIYAGILWLLSESPAGARRAGGYLQRVRSAESRGNSPREHSLAGLLSAWVDDDIPAALRVAERILHEDPRDLVVLKLHQYLSFNLGRPADLLRIALQVRSANAEEAAFHAMLAFAYEQCHFLSEAQAAASEALRLRPDEPWAQHALAHALLTRGRTEEGVAQLEARSGSWNRLNSFMRTHLWWHLCLFYLSQGREAEVLQLYDAQVWGVNKEYSQDQAGAVSLLARLEIAGVDVGQRWLELGEFLASRAEDTTLPFLSLHYLYGLARAGRVEADALLAAIHRRSHSAPDYWLLAWHEVALPAAEGLLAQARRTNPEITVARLGSALPGLIAIGGSHAQRDFFEQVWLDSVMRDGRWTVAQQLLEQRRARDPADVLVNRGLARVYGELGLPSQSQQAFRRAAEVSSRFHEARS
jgi:tetratricopeptide (TPR) repeat protein